MKALFVQVLESAQEMGNMVHRLTGDATASASFLVFFFLLNPLAFVDFFIAISGKMSALWLADD